MAQVPSARPLTMAQPHAGRCSFRESISTLTAAPEPMPMPAAIATLAPRTDKTITIARPSAQ